MRDTFVRTLLALAKEDRNIEIITGDLGFGVLKPFWEALPDQFINAGIAEQNMTAMAAGMAMEGKTVFTYSIGNFPTLRCIEQIRNDCAYHQANVKVVCVGGGFVYGSLGMSHHATEDLAILRAIPEVAVFAPADPSETEAVTRAIATHPGTCYLRLGRGGERKVHNKIDNFQIGKAIPVQQGSEVAIFSTGTIIDEVAAAAAQLESKGIRPTIYTFPTVKPIDREAILSCAESHKLIVTCEEHCVTGGFGSAVSEVLASEHTHAKLLSIGLSDQFCTHVGTQKYLRNLCGIDGPAIAAKILEALA